MIELLAYAAFFLTIALTYAIICLGLNVQWGQTGLFNVGVAGFVGRRRLCLGDPDHARHGRADRRFRPADPSSAGWRPSPSAGCASLPSAG